MSASEPKKNPVGVSILGSTGSVGTQTLDVIRLHRDRFNVVALAAGHNVELLSSQIDEFRPLIAATERTPDGYSFGHDAKVSTGPESLIEAATHLDADIVVVATSGHAGIEAALAAASAGKIIALANKETIVCAGELLFPLADSAGAEIRPIDSEHSAIWQAIGQSAADDVERIILTASGGPFVDLTLDELRSVTVGQALDHPTWNMGGKVTIDSATMMNKGLEILEARWLFGVDLDSIDVLIHRQSIVHSLVAFRDGSQRAQLGLPDMRQPIQYALTYPQHLESPCEPLDLAEISTMTFERVDEARFPATVLTRDAGKEGGTAPTVMSAADDVAVEAFLAGSIGFADIVPVIRATLDNHVRSDVTTLQDVTSADFWARQAAADIIRSG